MTKRMSLENVCIALVIGAALVGLVFNVEIFP